MGATLTWLKVVDSDRFRAAGGRVTPGLDSVVELPREAPSAAAPFLVLRAWHAFEGAFTESWVIRDPHGRTVHEGLDREVVAGTGRVADGGISDEVPDLEFDYADTGYQLVLSIDGREVARGDFEVRELPVT